MESRPPPLFRTGDLWAQGPRVPGSGTGPCGAAGTRTPLQPQRQSRELGGRRGKSPPAPGAGNRRSAGRAPGPSSRSAAARTSVVSRPLPSTAMTPSPALLPAHAHHTAPRNASPPAAARRRHPPGSVPPTPSRSRSGRRHFDPEPQTRPGWRSAHGACAAALRPPATWSAMGGPGRRAGPARGVGRGEAECDGAGSAAVVRGLCPGSEPLRRHSWSLGGGRATCDGSCDRGTSPLVCEGEQRPGLEETQARCAPVTSRHGHVQLALCDRCHKPVSTQAQQHLLML